MGAASEKYKKGREYMHSRVPHLIDQFEANYREFAPDILKMVYENAYGNLWAEGKLEDKIKSAITLAALVAVGGVEQLRFHVPVALKNGLSAEEIIQIVIHIHGYAGFPRCLNALSTLKGILEEPKK